MKCNGGKKHFLQPKRINLQEALRVHLNKSIKKKISPDIIWKYFIYIKKLLSSNYEKVFFCLFV